MKKEDRYDSLFQFYANQFNLDWKLLKAQARAESALDPDAVSHAGASGLCQFMPTTWNVDIVPKIKRYYEKTTGVKYTKHIFRFDPEDAIIGQCIYMQILIKQFGVINLALASYNWGPGRVSRLIKNQGTSDFNKLRNFMPDETKNYVARINKYYNGG